jgi:DNA repair exonuclease SbcCD ATPase subunit
MGSFKTAMVLVLMLVVLSPAWADDTSVPTPADVEGLQSHANELSKDLARVEAENRALQETIRRLSDENDALKKEIESLRATSQGTQSESQSEVATDKADAASTQIIKEDLANQIKDVRAELAKKRHRLSVLRQSTVDIPYDPPPGGKVEAPSERRPDGQIYRRETHTDYYNYEPQVVYVPIGPAIKRGDFRTKHEREAAIDQAKTEIDVLARQLSELETKPKTIEKEKKAADPLPKN